MALYVAATYKICNKWRPVIMCLDDQMVSVFAFQTEEWGFDPRPVH